MKNFSPFTFQRGYKYLFSDLEVTWQDAIAECTLYGGHLVDVNSQQEHNCLMRYGISQNFNSWFWIDGIFEFDQ